MSTRPAQADFYVLKRFKVVKNISIGHSQLSQVGPLQVYVVNTLTHFQHIIHSSMSTTPSRSWNSTKTTPGGPSCLCLKKAWKWFTTQWARPQAGPLHWRPHLPLHSPHPELVSIISTCHPPIIISIIMIIKPPDIVRTRALLRQQGRRLHPLQSWS